MVSTVRAGPAAEGLGGRKGEEEGSRGSSQQARITYGLDSSDRCRRTSQPKWSGAGARGGAGTAQQRRGAGERAEHG